MASIEKFLGKSKKVTIEGEELEIYPLTVNEIDLIIKFSNPEKQPEAIKQILSQGLKRTFPDATDEQIKQINVKYSTQFVEEILKVSGLETDKKKLEEMMVQ